jgi:Ca2+-binding EF-hand superfamily protein
MIGMDEFAIVLRSNGVFLDDLAIDAILTSLPADSDYRTSAILADRKRQDKLVPNGQLQIVEGTCFDDGAKEKGSLSFSDFCTLMGIDVPAKAVQKMQEAIKIFARFDADGSGAIDEDEAKDALAEMEKFTGVPVDYKMVQHALQIGGGELDFEMFVRIFGVDTGDDEAKIDDEVEKKYIAFQKIDLEQKGEIGIEDLKKGLNLLGIPLESDEVERMLREVLDDGSETIDFIKFCHINGQHNIPLRLKRKYIPGYEEGDHDHGTDNVTQVCSDAHAYEDDEAVVGHPDSRCKAVLGLRVTPSKVYRSGTYHAAGSIMEIVLEGSRVRVLHDDGFERYYDCGNAGRFELVTVPKVLLKDEDLSCYYKAQPHLLRPTVLSLETHVSLSLRKNDKCKGPKNILLSVFET